MRRQLVRTTLVVIGTISLVLGIAGIFLPLLPTTPFLLLTSACYVRGSERMHGWLMDHAHLGAYIRDYQAGRGIPRRAKMLTLAMLWSSVAFSVYSLNLVLLEVGQFILASTITVWLLRMPTAPPSA